MLGIMCHVVLTLPSIQPGDPGLPELDGVVLAAVWGRIRVRRESMQLPLRLILARCRLTFVL